MTNERKFGTVTGLALPPVAFSRHALIDPIRPERASTQRTAAGTDQRCAYETTEVAQLDTGCTGHHFALSLTNANPPRRSVGSRPGLTWTRAKVAKNK